MSKFIIKNIGEGLGDCFIIEIKGEKAEEECIILVDGRQERQGKLSFDYMKDSIKNYEKIDYLIITHIDDDHIGGILKLLELPDNDEVSERLSKTVIIYNSVVSSIIHYQQAERLEKILSTRNLINTCEKDYSKFSQNFLVLLPYVRRKKFDPDEYKLYRKRPVLTFIHPVDATDVEKVHEDYLKKKRNRTLNQTNSELVNRHSIVFLLEFSGKRVLFTGDAYIEDIFPKVLDLKNILIENSEEKSLLAASERKDKKIDIIKIPHHGTYENNKQLAANARKCDCRRFIVTGEKIWREKHPAKSLLNELYDVFGDQHIIYTPIDLSGYAHCQEVIKNTEEIDITEDEKNAKK